MKAPTPDACYYSDICAAAEVTVKQVETWIQRKAFVPSNPTVPGRSRIFCRDDAVRLRIMSQISKLGMTLDIASRASEYLRVTFGGNLASLLEAPSASLYMVLTADDARLDLTLHTETASLHRHVEQASGAITLNVATIGREAIDRLMQHIRGELAQDEAFRAAGAPTETLFNDKEE